MTAEAKTVLTCEDEDTIRVEFTDDFFFKRVRQSEYIRTRPGAAARLVKLLTAGSGYVPPGEAPAGHEWVWSENGARRGECYWDHSMNLPVRTSQDLPEPLYILRKLPAPQPPASTPSPEVKELVEALRSTMRTLEPVARNGWLSQGGEQRGNWLDIVDTYRKLERLAKKYTLQ